MRTDGQEFILEKIILLNMYVSGKNHVDLDPTAVFHILKVDQILSSHTTVNQDKQTTPY